MSASKLQGYTECIVLNATTEMGYRILWILFKVMTDQLGLIKIMYICECISLFLYLFFSVSFVVLRFTATSAFLPLGAQQLLLVHMSDASCLFSGQSEELLHT